MNQSAQRAEYEDSCLASSLPGGVLGQVCAEVLEALSATEPRTSRDIFDHVTSAENGGALSKAMYTLRKRGLIVQAGIAEPTGKPGAGRVPSYVLSDQASDLRLAAHLERELAEHPPISESEQPIARESASEMDTKENDANERTTWTPIRQEVVKKTAPKKPLSQIMDSVSPENRGAATNALKRIVDKHEKHEYRWSQGMLRELDAISEPKMLGAAGYAFDIRMVAESPLLRRAPLIRERLNHIASVLEAAA